jgi:hypothetical protein
MPRSGAVRAEWARRARAFCCSKLRTAPLAMRRPVASARASILAASAGVVRARRAKASSEGEAPYFLSMEPHLQNAVRSSSVNR